MEKNQKIGFILIILTLLIFSVINRPSKELIEKQKHQRDSIALAQKLDLANKAKPSPSAFANISEDTTILANAKSTYGDIATALTGNEEITVLENDDLILKLSNKGGRVISAELKKYKKSFTPDTKQEDKAPLLLLEDSKNRFEYTLPLGAKGDTLSSQDVFFTTNKNGNTVSFSIATADGKRFEQIYTLPTTGYQVDYTVKSNGLGEKMKLRWINYLDRIEPGKMYEKTYSSVYYKEVEQDVDYCSCNKSDEKSIEKKLRWISNSNQFFNSSLIASSDKLFDKAILSVEMYEDSAEDMKKITSVVQVPLEGGENKMQFFIGPNDYHKLSAVNAELEEIIPFGASIFGSLNRWIIRPAFDFLSNLLNNNKGWAIILFIFIIKMLLYPLLYKMLLSQAKMGALKPELAVIKEKNKDDLQKQQVETMKVYQEFGVSPFSGCFPMLLQMPIWIALYRFFPASLTFRQEGFLWANDLSTFDPLFKLGFEMPFMGSHISLFTLLWAVSTLVYTYHSMKNVDMSANPAMKYVQYFMPLMFLGFFNNYASGLTCYMFFSNLINILQTIVTKTFVFDDEKIRKQLDLQKSNPKKKAGFALKMEDLMKQQQAIQEQKKKQIKK